MDSPNANALLTWYDRHARNLPWRVLPKNRRRGERADPYRVWLSEIMLQQTTIATVRAYFMRFTHLWPTLEALGQADLDEILTEWSGLGYYTRARKLKECADTLLADHGGAFPQNAARLIDLPGIGPYTSAAIAAIAFGEPIAVVDGNVERVFTRLYALEEPLPKVKESVRARVQKMVPGSRAGEFAEATMDLGATICTPRKPACGLCPWRTSCKALAVSQPDRFPVKAAKKEKPTREGTAFVAIRADGHVLLRKRPARGLLAAMAEVPGTNWAKLRGEVPSEEPPFAAKWIPAVTPVRHTFTHFHLRLTVERADLPKATTAPTGSWWARLDQLEQEPLPTVMRKAIAAAAEPGAGSETEPNQTTSFR